MCVVNVIVIFFLIIVFRYDTGKDKFIDFEELKHMMEKLGAPQTHLALKEMISVVDEDKDGKINFREVLSDWSIDWLLWFVLLIGRTSVKVR